MTQYIILEFLQENKGKKYTSRQICLKIGDRNPRKTARKAMILVRWGLVKVIHKPIKNKRQHLFIQTVRSCQLTIQMIYSKL